MTKQKPITKTNLFLLAFAGLCLAIALTIAWVLGITLFFPDGVLAGLLIERADIIRAHIDYLMMPNFCSSFSCCFGSMRSSRRFGSLPPVVSVHFSTPCHFWSGG
ncbi:MAG: hypothetical protein ACXWFA_18195 [Methylobacter sp.]